MAGSATITGVQHYFTAIGHPKTKTLTEAPTGSALVVTADASFTLTADYDGVQVDCTTALTITIPELLDPRPSFVVIPPPSGDVTLDPTGAAQLNGLGTTLTRGRTSNPAGVAIVAYTDADGYGVSGSGS